MRLAALPALLVLAACSAERQPDAPATPAPTVAAPRTLVAADLDPELLGARIIEMEVADQDIGDGLAKVSAFVACPKAMAVCDPATAPEGTVYTYVLSVTPQTAPEPVPASPTADTAAAPADASAGLIRMTRPAHGFNAAAGFSRAEATAALGAEDALTVTLDENGLVWRVTGGNGWAVGRPITLWWQTTRAPAQPAASYRLEYAGQRAAITAPFPAADEAATAAR